MSVETLLRISEILKETHPRMEEIFTRGGCYEFFRIMNAVDTRAEPYYHGPKSHVVTRLGNTLIDINGIYPTDTYNPGIVPMDEEPRLLLDAHYWKKDFWK